MISDWVDWPGRPQVPMSVIVAPWFDMGDASPMAGAAYSEVAGAVSGSATWPVANRAYYIPVYVLAPMQIVQMIWRNGTVANGNVDVGIYSRNFVRLASSTPYGQNTPSVGQAAAVAITLMPELYYLAISVGNNVATLWRWTYGATLGPLLAHSVGIRIEDTAHPLPAVATPVKPLLDFVPLVAASGRTLV